MTETALDAGAYRDAMARLASAVHVITTVGPGGRAGFTASAVCSVSDTPPTLLVCLKRASSAAAAFGLSDALCVNALAAEQAGIAAAFGGGAPMEERFGGLAWSALSTGAPVLAGALASFDCRVTRRAEIGSHDVLFCEVVALAARPGADGLFYADRRYHAVPRAVG